MKLTVCKNELLKGLENASKGITGKSNMPILEGFKIVVDDNISITATDLDFSIQTSVAAMVEESGSIVLNKKILDIIKKMPEDKVFLESNDNDLTVSSGKTKLKMPFMNVEEYPELPNVSSNAQINIKSEILKNLLKSVVYAVAKDDVRPILQGVLFEIKDNKLNLVALDGYRLAKRTISIDYKDNIACVIPGKTLMEVIKLLSLDKEVLISIEGSHILFDIEGTIVTSKLLEGNFVNYEALLQQESKTKVTVDKDNLQELLDRTLLVSVERQLVKLNLKDDNLHSSSNSSFGIIEEDLSCIIEGEPIEIAFNTGYLLDILKNTSDENITFSFVSPTSPCTIEGEGYLHLVLPVRIM